MSIGRSQLTESSLSPQKSVMTVQVPRSKLRGSLGHSHEHFSLNPTHSDYSAVFSDAPRDMLGVLPSFAPPTEGMPNIQQCSAIDAGVNQVVLDEKPPKGEAFLHCTILCH